MIKYVKDQWDIIVEQSIFNLRVEVPHLEMRTNQRPVEGSSFPSGQWSAKWHSPRPQPIRCGPSAIEAVQPFSKHSSRGKKHGPDRKSVVEGQGVSVRVGLGGCRIIKKNNKQVV